MITLKKADRAHSEEAANLFKLLKKIHKPAAHTIKVLTENKHIKDFCETSQHFVLIKEKPEIYLSYQVNSWIEERMILCSFETIHIYDDWNEYNRIRLQNIHSGSVVTSSDLN